MSDDLERIRERMDEALQEARAIERASSGTDPGLIFPDRQLKEIVSLEARRSALEEEKRALELRTQAAEAAQGDLLHRLELSQADAAELRERLSRAEATLKERQEASRDEHDRLEAALNHTAAQLAQLQAQARTWAYDREMLVAEMQRLRDSLAVLHRPWEGVEKALEEKLRAEQGERHASLAKELEDARVSHQRQLAELEARSGSFIGDLERRLQALNVENLKLQERASQERTALLADLEAERGRWAEKLRQETSGLSSVHKAAAEELENRLQALGAENLKLRELAGQEKTRLLAGFEAERGRWAEALQKEKSRLEAVHETAAEELEKRLQSLSAENLELRELAGQEKARLLADFEAERGLWSERLRREKSELEGLHKSAVEALEERLQQDRSELQDIHKRAVEGLEKRLQLLRAENRMLQDLAGQERAGVLEGLQEEKGRWSERFLREMTGLEALYKKSAEELDQRLQGLFAENLKLREQAEQEKRRLLAGLEAERGRWAETLRQETTGLEGRLESLKAENLRLQEEADRRRARSDGELAELKAALSDQARQADASTRELETRLAQVQEEKAVLERRLRAAPPPPAEAPVEQLPPEPVPGAFPTLQDVLDPAWAKLVAALKVPLANALGHMRRLAASRLPGGALGLLRMAAGELCQAQDALKAWGQFLEEAGPAPATGRVEAAVERALASWETVFRARKIAIVRKGQRDLPPARFHPDSLRVALFQVLRNAYEAMPAGGVLAVETSTDPASGGTRVVFSDTGRGFSEEALAGLFTPFAPAKPGRLGLGLAIVRRTLRACGGEADAGNGERGAYVALRFPPCAEPPPPLSESGS